MSFGFLDNEPLPTNTMEPPIWNSFGFRKARTEPWLLSDYHKQAKATNMTDKA